MPWVDAAFATAERELAAAGGLIAGGLAYRLFLWLVPLGLVCASVLGLVADYDREHVEDVADEFGIGATAVASAAQAVEQDWRLLALLSGVVLLLWFSVGVVRALRLSYALAWGLERPRGLQRPLSSALALNGLVVGGVLLFGLLAWLRETLGLGALLAAAALLGLQVAFALFVMTLLPSRTESPRDLLPGAVLVAVGNQLVHVAVVFYFVPRLERSSEVYGALGTATVLLVWLYVVARLLTGAAFFNATLWERRQATTE
jgi:uncharacterized BrkB/YihY/UPF0761 family membrane protein